MSMCRSERACVHAIYMNYNNTGEAKVSHPPGVSGLHVKPFSSLPVCDGVGELHRLHRSLSRENAFSYLGAALTRTTSKKIIHEPTVQPNFPAFFQRHSGIPDVPQNNNNNHKNVKKKKTLPKRRCWAAAARPKSTPRFKKLTN